MRVTIHPSSIKGSIFPPPSKSSTQRALAAGLIRKGKSIITGAGNSNDDKAALAVIKALGANVYTENEKLIIISKGVRPDATTVNCGESGLGIRMFAPIIALSNQSITITGEGSLLNRPMNFFNKIFPEIGISIKGTGKLPVEVKGPLVPRDIEIDGSVSSQFLTGLLMAYSASGAADVSIKVNNLASKPYIDLTLSVMKDFGMNVPENRNYEEFYFLPAYEEKTIDDVQYTVERDWSAAAFLLVAGAVAGPVTVRGLDISSTQADKKILDALMAANAALAIDAKGIQIHPVDMDAFYFEASDCPDLFPPLVTLAAYCKGTSRISGVGRLVHKESNRALTLQDEFDKMGVTIQFENDEMLIFGNGKVKGADVMSHHDHRIAMACAVAALKADSEMVIEDAEAVNKSYPDFFSDLKTLGAAVSLPGHLNL